MSQGFPNPDPSQQQQPGMWAPQHPGMYAQQQPVPGGYYGMHPGYMPPPPQQQQPGAAFPQPGGYRAPGSPPGGMIPGAPYGGANNNNGGNNTAASSPDADFYKGFYEAVVRTKPSSFGTVMSWVGPLVVNLAMFLGPVWYLRRRYLKQSGFADMAKKAGGNPNKGFASMMEMMMPLKPKQYRVEVKGTTFDDVIGVPEAKEELKQYVDFLAHPERFTKLGARLPKGCLLTGQPGTGKTLLAKAVAGESKQAFFSVSGADFIEVFGGSGPKRVRELFAEAREAAPCVVFIDEIDAIGSRGNGRGMSGGGGGSSEENRTINQLLAELDGLNSSKPIVVIAATNFPDNIDKALLRDGRFDRKVNIPMPDHEARVDLFQYYLSKVVTGDPSCKPRPMVYAKKVENASGSDSTTNGATASTDGAAAEVKKEFVTEAIPAVVIPGVNNRDIAASLADRTPGTSPAQINAIVNEAALAAATSDEQVVTLPYLQNAIDDVLVGKKHRQRMGDASLRRTAYHECGHAIMSWTSPLQKDVLKISIIPRGRAGGYTQQMQDEAMEPKTNEFLFSQLCVLLGGRVAERIALGDISTGAVDDLQRATRIAMDQLLSYGMGKEIGQMAFRSQGDKSNGRSWFNYSEDLHARVELEAKALVERAYQHTLKTLTEKKPLLTSLAETLLQKKELMKTDVVAILGPRPAGSQAGKDTPTLPLAQPAAAAAPKAATA